MEGISRTGRFFNPQSRGVSVVQREELHDRTERLQQPINGTVAGSREGVRISRIVREFRIRIRPRSDPVVLQKLRPIVQTTTRTAATAAATQTKTVGPRMSRNRNGTTAGSGRVGTAKAEAAFYRGRIHDLERQRWRWRRRRHNQRCIRFRRQHQQQEESRRLVKCAVS